MRVVRLRDNATGLVVTGADGRDLAIDLVASLPAIGAQDPAAGTLLADILAESSWIPLIDEWSAAVPVLRRLERRADDILAEAQSRSSSWVVTDLADRACAPPLPAVGSRVFALGGNFADHVARIKTKTVGRPVTEAEIRREKDEGLPPWGFLVIPDVIVGDGDVVEPPRGTKFLDYEGEVAVILARGGRNLAEADVAVWGVTAFNDFSIRDGVIGDGPGVDRGPLVWALAKNFQSGKAMGPWVVVGDLPDVHDLHIETKVNGQTRQSAPTSQMIYNFAEAASYLSRFIELRAGDIIASGTPAGTAVDRVDGAFLRPGDEVEVHVADVGVLRNRINSW